MALIEPRDIDLNLLVIFQEVFQERQISSVARRLGLSQPAVSNALARLRRSFGDELFVRTAQGMQPPPFAEQLAEPVAAALQQLARSVLHAGRGVERLANKPRSAVPPQIPTQITSQLRAASDALVALRGWAFETIAGAMDA